MIKLNNLKVREVEEIKKKIKMMHELEEEEALELERKEDAAVLAAALARREGVAREDGVRQVSLSSERRFGAGVRLVVCSAAAGCLSCIQIKSMPCTN